MFRRRPALHAVGPAFSAGLVLVVTMAAASPPHAPAAPVDGAPDEDLDALPPTAMTPLPVVDITAGPPLMTAQEPGCENPFLAPGFLSLNTAPWTRIEIDGDPVGSTPVFRMRLPPGAHQLALHNEAEGLVVERTVDIEPQKTLKLNLVLGARHIGNDLVLLDDGRPADPLDCGEDLAHASFLSVQTQPWSKVFVDGKHVGSTPIFKHPVEPGDHVLRLESESGGKLFSRFNVAAGETVKVDLLH